MRSTVSATSTAPFTASIMAAAVSEAIAAPFFTAFMELSMRAEVFLEASAVSPARFLTSFAMTVKPFPATPALAASTEALSARIFVWSAMDSMVSMMLPISRELLLISSMAAIIRCIC